MDCCGENLLLLGTAIAIRLGQTFSADELATLSTLLTVIAEQLTFLAAVKEQTEEDS